MPCSPCPFSGPPIASNAVLERSAQAQGKAHGAFNLVLARRQADALVELHLDVGAEQPLDLDGALRRQHVLRAVEMGAERHAGVVELSKLGQGHHLEAAGIGKDGVRPVA